MSLTWIGVLVFALGAWLLLAGPRLAMLVFAFVCTMFNGSAVVTVTALGSISVQPGLAATGLLFLRLLLPERNGGDGGTVPAALRDNAWLVLMVSYCFVGAYTLPVLFRDTIAVIPLRPSAGAVIAVPLGFSTQNFTTSFYMVMTLLAALAAHATANRAGAADRLARMACAITLVHALLGWIGMAARGTALDLVFDAIRNGHYAQLDQSFGAWVRLNGVSPEPSIYAAYGFTWLVVVSELWLRNVHRDSSGPAALLMLITLLASTSTTGYLGLAVYGLLIALRLLFMPGSIPAAKTALMLALVLVGVAAAITLLVTSEALSELAARVLRISTTDKLTSASGQVRTVWALQGIDAFLASYGLGIGAGSFRSSSIVTAIIGSGGVIATLAIMLHLARVFRPTHPDTWRGAGVIERDTAAACGWGACMALAAAALSAPSPDPGILWGLLAGAALGLARRAAAAVATGDTLRPVRLQA